MAFEWRDNLRLARFLRTPRSGSDSWEKRARKNARRTMAACAEFLKHKRRAGVAERLRFLRRLRNACDYDADSEASPPEDSLIEVLAAAEYVFESLAPPEAAS